MNAGGESQGSDGDLCAVCGRYSRPDRRLCALDSYRRSPRYGRPVEAALAKALCRHHCADDRLSFMKFRLLLLLPLAALASAQRPDPLTSVDPFIGTGGEGHTFPGRHVPVRDGAARRRIPQIRPFKQSYKWAAGYRYEDTTILGFSHTHFSGAGHSDLGDVLLTPTAATRAARAGRAPRSPQPAIARASRHEDEQAEPGYYAVTLEDPGVQRRADRHDAWACIATPFPRAPSTAHLSARSALAASTTIPARCCGRVCAAQDGTITGLRETRGWAPGRQLYFAMRFSAAGDRARSLQPRGRSTAV